MTEEFLIRQRSMELALEQSRGNSASIDEIIANAKKIEAYLSGSDGKTLEVKAA